MTRSSFSPVRLLLAGLTAIALTLFAGTPAQAAASQDAFVYWDEGSTRIGDGWFNADPLGSIPGDSINACDRYADGYGIEVWLDINPSNSSWDTDRVASTRGHSSPYCSPWMSGDIAEGTHIRIKICKVSGTYTSCLFPRDGYA